MDKFDYTQYTHLLLNARKHWFNNESGIIKASGVNITRADIQLFGGPSPEYNGCETCQSMEWASRVAQSNCWRKHKCSLTDDLLNRCIASCKKQGSEWWTQTHHNYWYACGINPTLKAPRMAVFYHQRGYGEFHTHGGFHVTINKKRCFAQTAQIDIYLTKDFNKTQWDKYDVAFVHNRREMDVMKKPPVPVVMLGWDCWKGNPQAAINYLQPEVLLSPTPQLWRDNLKIPDYTKVMLYAAGEGNYFTRPNLTTKSVDLVVLGALSSRFYKLRKELNKQLESLPSRYLRMHLHEPNHGKATPDLPIAEHRGFLNVYVDQIGRGRYATFGPCCGDGKSILAMKTYECLGSGAIPILPEVPDIKRLGITPWVHYIPFSEIWQNNDRLMYLLDHYDEHKFIAVNAVKWHKENADRLLFGGFEDAIRIATENKFAKRIY